LRGQCEEEEEREVEIRWKTTAHIPADFVPVEAQRLMLYRKVAEAKTVEQLDDVMAEITDRYGEVQSKGASLQEGLPEPVEHLLDVARLRILGRRMRIRKIIGMPKGFKLFRDSAVSVFSDSARRLIRDGNPTIFTDDPGALEFQYRDRSSRDLLGEAVGALRHLAAG
jgi:transcription-repair coupling factor (superfamily II helicase)